MENCNRRLLLFIDRDGTLIEEPPDQQVDSLAKLKLAPRVIPALLALQAAGYELVMISNQDGLGTAAFPTEAFETPQRALLSIFASQGIHFSAQHICPHLPDAGCRCRKPELGLVLEYLTAGDLDRCAGRVIGDRDSDMELAERMGIAGIHYGRGGMGWDAIAHALSARPRTAKVRRVTRETEIIVKLDLDASGDIEISTGIGFFDHMLEQLAKHGGFNLMLTCRGDLAIDEHHTVEDTALALGQALREALGNKRGLARYGFLLPMDEALAQVAVDLGGRAYCVFNASFQRERVGELPTELVPHFFQSLAQAAGATVHIQVGGDNAHHMIEAAFKATGRALRQALVREGEELPSTKGIL